jgi:hypothetical protein
VFLSISFLLLPNTRGMRGVQDLESLRDDDVRDADLQYIKNHSLTQLLSQTMEQLLIQRPTAPIPFMIDCIKLGPDMVSQDNELGISTWRKHSLKKVFYIMSEVRYPA